MATCKYCGEDFKEIFKHQWAEHRKQMLERSRRSLPPGGNWSRRARDRKAEPEQDTVATESAVPSEGKKAQEKAAARTTPNLADAVSVTIVPKTMTINSTLFQIAKVVTEREWNWPEMEPGDWLDTYLYETMKQRGVTIGAYHVVRGGNDGD